MARDRIQTVNLQFLKLVKVLHISLLQKVDFVQVFVYISYHPYVFICILRFLGFICIYVTCMYSYFTFMYPYAWYNFIPRNFMYFHIQCISVRRMVYNYLYNIHNVHLLNNI